MRKNPGLLSGPCSELLSESEGPGRVVVDNTTRSFSFASVTCLIMREPRAILRGGMDCPVKEPTGSLSFASVTCLIMREPRAVLVAGADCPKGAHGFSFFRKNYMAYNETLVRFGTTIG